VNEVRAVTGTNEDLKSRVQAFYWHHSIDLGAGVVTAGGKSLELCEREAALIFDRIDLKGRTVLDIGAWNGFFSFAAKRRGATSVLATDSFCWKDPGFRGRETFEIARDALRLDVSAREIDVAEMSTESVGTFDIVLYLGVFYHRYDAIEALARVAPLAGELLVLETHLELRDVQAPAMRFFPGTELANDPTNWWGPNELCIRDLLLGHGFEVVEMTAHPVGHNRAIFHAWRKDCRPIAPVAEDDRLKPLAESKAREFSTKHPVLSKLRALVRWFRLPIGANP